MSEQLTVADALERAADLIEPEGHWTQGALRRDSKGRIVWHKDGGAVCFCINGALMEVAGNRESVPSEPYRFLQDLLHGEPAFWNDRRSRTQAQVVAKLREAAALAREQGA